MLETENNLQNNTCRKQNLKRKSMLENKYYLAAKYLSKTFLDFHNLKDPKSKTSNHLIKIFLYFLRYNVYNIDLIKSFSKEKGDFLEFKVNFFSQLDDNTKENNNSSNEVISISSFFNNNIKLIII